MISPFPRIAFAEVSRRCSEGIIGCALIAVSGVAAWATRRGFDFIDGGLYYLACKYPADFADTHTSYHLVARPFYLLAGENIVGFRALSWLIVLLSVWLLSRGLKRVSIGETRQPDRRSWRMAGAAMFISSFEVFGVAPESLNYNSLNAILTFGCVGLFLQVLSQTDGHFRQMPRTAALSFAAAVGLSAIQLFVKPTTSLLLLGAMLGYGLFSRSIDRRSRVNLARLHVAGGLAAGAISVALLGGVKPLFARLSTFWSISSNLAYTSSLVTRTGRELVFLATRVGADLWLPITLGLVVVVAARIAFGTTRAAWIVAVGAGAAAASWIFVMIQKRTWMGGHEVFAEAGVTRFYLEWLVVLSFAALLTAWLRQAPATPRSPSRSQRWPVGLLLLAPFAGAFGTSNPIYLNAIFQVPCWCALGIVLLSGLARTWNWPALLPVGLLPVALFSSVHFINGKVYHPYALKTDLRQQDTPTRVGEPATTLLLDAETSRFVDETRRILSTHGFKPGNDLFAFFNLPGLVYAVGGRSPVIPWYFGRIYGNNHVEESYMLTAGDTRRRHAYILTQGDADKFTQHYIDGGFDFPTGYELIGELTNPVSAMAIKIWRPRSGPR